MAKIVVDLDSKADTDAATLAAEILRVTETIPGAVFKLEYDGQDLYLEGDFITTPNEVTEETELPVYTRVVQVRGQYTYTLYVDDHGDVRPGGTVDVEARNGGHWSGKVTKVWPSVEDYLKDEGVEEAPTLMVLEVIDPGPAA